MIAFCAFTILPIYFFIVFDDDAHASTSKEISALAREVSYGDGSVGSKPSVLFTTTPPRSPLVPLQNAILMSKLRKRALLVARTPKLSIAAGTVKYCNLPPV